MQLGPLKPLKEILLLLRSTTGRGFADRHPNKDVVLVEPYEKGRDYGPAAPFHSQAKVMFLARTKNRPISVGRDARAMVMLDHPAVSRLHVVMAYTDAGWKAMDRSSNGSYMAGERMPRERAMLIGQNTLRLGRAVVIRVFTPEQFHHYANSTTHESSRGPADQPAADPSAETWRIPVDMLKAAMTEASPPPVDGEELELEFEYDDLPPKPGAKPRPPSPPTQRHRRKKSDDDLEFEFDFDVDYG